MKIVASMIVRDELSRYLPLCIRHLQTFCDEIRVLDDASSDGSYEWLIEQDNVSVKQNPVSSFFTHEGRARQALFEWTLEAAPSHILAIDADEFIADPGALCLAARDRDDQVLILSMQEIWKADRDQLHIRVDNLWRPHGAPILYRPPPRANARWRIRDRALACGREPEAVRRNVTRGSLPVTEILHFGWTEPRERARRYQRYVVHDGGRFHQDRHIQSIMWPPEQIQLQARPWPESLTALREKLTK